MVQDTSTPKRKKPLITIILICSLGLNLLFVGGLIGRFMLGGPPNHLPNNMGWMVRHLDDEHRKKLKPLLRDYSKASRPVRMEMRAARQRLNVAMQSDPLDEAAVELALKDLRAASNAFQIALHENMVTILKEMEPEQRRDAMKFIERREDGRRHFEK